VPQCLAALTMARLPGFMHANSGATFATRNLCSVAGQSAPAGHAVEGLRSRRRGQHPAGAPPINDLANLGQGAGEARHRQGDPPAWTCPVVTGVAGGDAAMRHMPGLGGPQREQASLPGAWQTRVRYDASLGLDTDPVSGRRLVETSDGAGATARVTGTLFALAAARNRASKRVARGRRFVCDEA
jgi:hypothetical protein